MAHERPGAAARAFAIRNESYLGERFGAQRTRAGAVELAALRRALRPAGMRRPPGCQGLAVGIEVDQLARVYRVEGPRIRAPRVPPGVTG
jgi:hypothetical protein